MDSIRWARPGHAARPPNAMAFANTALKPQGVLHPMRARRLFYDRGNLNATFVPVDVEMTDKYGLPRTERMMAVIALDNLMDAQANPHAQVRADYGDRYLSGLLQRFKDTFIQEQAALAEPAPLKTEPSSDEV